MAGFVYAPFGDLEAVEQADRRRDRARSWSSRSRAKGASAFRPRVSGRACGELCDEHGLLLIFDEVQTGCGRTGEWFAYQHFGVTPDVMTLAKALCGGIAGGALLTTAEIAPSLRPGMHAATFGGNPIAARAGIATLEMIEQREPARKCQAARRSLPRAAVGAAAGVRPDSRGARGRRDDRHRAGDRGRAGRARRAWNGRLLVNCTHSTVLRLLPAMNLTDEQAHEGCDILADVIKQASTQRT